MAIGVGRPKEQKVEVNRYFQGGSVKRVEKKTKDTKENPPPRGLSISSRSHGEPSN